MTNQKYLCMFLKNARKILICIFNLFNFQTVVRELQPYLGIRNVLGSNHDHNNYSHPCSPCSSDEDNHTPVCVETSQF